MDGKLRNMTSIYLYDESDRVLLLNRIGSRVVKKGYVGSAGGHFEKDELNDAKACVLRELEEETKLVIEDIENLQLRYVTLRYKNSEIRQNYYFFAKLKNKDKKIESNEGELKWFDFAEICNLEMPHTAKFVIEHYIKEGQKNNKLYGGIAIEEGVEFCELREF